MAESPLRSSCSENKTEPELICDLCRMDDLEVIAVKYCVKCMDWLCNSCFKRHTNNAVFKTHNTVDKDGLPLNITPQTLRQLKGAIFCGTHEVQLEYMCNDHMELICKICIRKTHRNCNQISQLQTSVNPVLRELQCTKKQLQTKMERQQDRITTISEDNEKQIKLRSSVIADILDFLKRFGETDGQSEFETADHAAQSVLKKSKSLANSQDKNEHLLKAVLFLNDEEKAKVVAKYVQVSLGDIKPYLVDSESNSNEKRSLKEMLNCLEKVKCITSELVNIYCPKASSLESLSRILTCKDPEAGDTNIAIAPDFHTFESTSSSLETDDAACGALQSKITNTDTTDYISQTCMKDKCHTDDSVSGARQSHFKNADTKDDESKISIKDKLHSNPALSKRTLRHVANYNVRLTGEKECCISSIVVLRSGRIIITDSSNICLKVYDGFMDLKFVHKLNRRPVDLCVTDADKDPEQVAVSFNPRRVEIYAIHGDTIKQIRGFDLSLHCRGICSMNSNAIAILMSNVESMNKRGAFPDITSRKDTIKIQLREIKEGRVVNTIAVFSHEIICPIYIKPDNKGNIVLGEEKQVSAFNAKGERLWCYNSHEGRMLDGVLGMSMDPEGNIYICSSGSDNIHQVSSSNYKCNRIVLDNLPSPGSIAFDPCQERLIVRSDQLNTIYVYKFI